MQPLCAALLLLFVGVSVAYNPADPCEQCDYNNGVGYVPVDYRCRLYYQCTVYPDGSFAHKPQCCGNRTKWDQETKACIFGYCDDDYTDCPEVIEGPDDCLYYGLDGSDHFKSTRTHQSFNCGFGTSWDQETCGCINNGEHEQCSSDPILHWPFGSDFIDIQCHHIRAKHNGEDPISINDGKADPKLNNCIHLNGKDQYLSFDFLNNNFANKENCFSISIWFYQDQAGWDHVNNYPYEGLVGNGNCQSEGGTSSMWFGFSKTYQVGYVETTEGAAEFNVDDDDVAERDALFPEQWCQFGLSFNNGRVTTYLNGNLTSERNVDGDFKNGQAPWTIGLSIIDCVPYFFTGCVDDLIVFDRCVGDAEMFNLFSNSQQQYGENYPYIRTEFN